MRFLRRSLAWLLLLLVVFLVAFVGVEVAVKGDTGGVLVLLALGVIGGIVFLLRGRFRAGLVGASVGALVGLFIADRVNAHSQNVECMARVLARDPCFAFSTFGYVLMAALGAVVGWLFVVFVRRIHSSPPPPLS